MKKNLLYSAIKTAQTKLKHHPERIKGFIHYAFIVQHNQIVEWATNGRLEPPLHYGYHSSKNDITFVPKFHAEIWAYKRARGILEDGFFEIINIRLNKLGKLRLSKPCRPCFELLSAVGCKNFYFSSEVGFLELPGSKLMRR